MGSFWKIWRLGVKELRSLWHDPVMLALIATSFSLLVYTGAKATRHELRNAPIAVVDHDHSHLSERLITAFYLPRFKTPERISSAEMDSGLDLGRYTFVLDIPQDFERDVRQGRDPELQVNIDATRMSQAYIGAGYIQNIVHDELAEFMRQRGKAADPPIRLVPRVVFNPNLEGVWFGGVMEVINQVTLISIILTGAALIREREHGTLEHLMVMPLSPFQVMTAKVWANGLVVLIAAALSLLLVVQGALSVPIAGSIALFVIGTALHLFSTTSIGILLATVVRSMPQLGLLVILVVLPFEILSGAITPRESMPVFVQRIMLAAPTTHFVSLAQAILYRGAGLDVVWPQFCALVAIGAVAFAGALARFRRSVSLA
ncbi:MAG TPA: ABC transporter permease [Myxococcota bacterium]|nr:ABC transporter permease [Myxococcota bacterium]